MWWYNDGSNISTLEKETLKIYHVLEDINYGMLRIYAKKSTHRLSEELGASKDTINGQIRILGKSYRSCRSVPPQAQRGVDICLQLIGNPMDDRFIRRIFTYVEKWIYYRNPEASKQ